MRQYIIKEHYIAGKSRFGRSNAAFCVLDTRIDEEYNALLFDESLEVKKTKIFRVPLSGLLFKRLFSNLHWGNS